MATPAEDCDRLAAHPDDTQGPGSGVYSVKSADAAAARAACAEAVAQFPDMPRYKYQLGRALIAENLKGRLDCRPGLEALVGAVEQGHAEAAYLIAWCGMGNHGVTFEVEQHDSLLHQSSRMGSLTARTMLARRMVASQEQTALTQGMAQLREMAQAGNTTAMLELVRLYSRGRWIPRDEEQAHRYRLAAAERGHRMSQYLIGKDFVEGKNGAPRDPVRGRQFLERAEDNGESWARGALRDLDAEDQQLPQPPKTEPKRYKAPASGGLLPGSKVVE